MFELHVIALMFVASLCAISFNKLMIARKSDIFGFYPILLQKMNIPEKIKKPLGLCARCFSAWLFIIPFFFLFGFHWYIIPGCMITILLTDQISKLLNYE